VAKENGNALFSHEALSITVLRERAYNYRWATVDKGVIPLTAADPDFPVAEEILNAMREYLQPGVLSYGPPSGLPEFKEAIAHWYFTTKNVEYKTQHILPVDSAAFALFLAAKTFLKKGDKAIVLEPVDFLFRRAIEYAGATVITSSLNKKTGEINILDIEAQMDQKVKAIFICNPNNPLGKTLSLKDLKSIGALAIKHNLHIISDEIWADICYDNSFISIASLNEEIKNRTIVISGLSKNFALAGLRVGYICTGNQRVYDKLFETSHFASTAFGVSTLSQIAATAALTKGGLWLSAFLKHLESMRDYSLLRLNAMKDFEMNAPNSTYLLFPKLKNTKRNSEEFCDYLLKEAGVALIPGGEKWFEKSSEGHIRICYSTSHTILKEAFDRMEHTLGRL
jgi:aminotransferase